MTLPAVLCVNRYTGNGLIGAYAFEWLLPEADQLLVMTYDPSTDVGLILVAGVDYTLPSAAVNNPAGGTITLTAGNLASGVILTILRDIPDDQTTSIRNSGDFYPSAHEDTFDRLVMQIQQLAESQSRAVALSPALDPNGFNPALPTAIVNNPDAYLKVNPSGTGFALSTAVTPPNVIPVLVFTNPNFNHSSLTSFFTWAPPVDTESILEVTFVARLVADASYYAMVKYWYQVSNKGGVVAVSGLTGIFTASNLGNWGFTGTLTANQFDFKFGSSDGAFALKAFVSVFTV